MPISTLSVAERIQALKKIFNDFGIQVPANSILEQEISSEFGRGKRSVLNRIITDLHQESDAAVLAECIGHALMQKKQDPQIAAIGSVMRERLPSLLHILDVRQNTTKRLQLLEQLLKHFENKLQAKDRDVSQGSERLLRMLNSTRQQLRSNVELQAAGEVIFRSGVVFDVRELRKFGKILQGITPVLVSLEQEAFCTEQTINYCVNALRVIGNELRQTKLIKVAAILDDIHWLAQVILPTVPDNAKIEDALYNLGISIGTTTLHQLKLRAKASGLTEKEIIQILYNNKAGAALSSQDQLLLAATQQNKQFAATCGYLAKLGQELKCKEMERVGIAGICLVSMRQTFFELKTHNLNVVNFSESLGLMLTSAGVLAKNQTLVTIGSCILDGVKAYAGIMAIPGGQAIAIPLAIGTALGKLILSNRAKPGEDLISTELILQQILQQVVKLHIDMRQQFADLYTMLQQQHQQLLFTLDEGFKSLDNYMQCYNSQTTKQLHYLDHKVDMLRFSISKEFSDLYLEYIRDPIEEIEFYDVYKQGTVQQLNQNKHKLSMWLLYKAKHTKVNGVDLLSALDGSVQLAEFVTFCLQKITDSDAVLSMINRYVNLEFKQQLSEQLPHIPTWLLGANSYILLLNDYCSCIDRLDLEPQVITDIIAIGEQIQNFVLQLAVNQSLFKSIAQKLHQQCDLASVELMKHSKKSAVGALSTLELLGVEVIKLQQYQQIFAYAAATDQLELFDAHNLDISDVWHKCLKQHLPVEFLLATQFALGGLYVTYTLDAAVNAFVNVRMPYCQSALPDGARDVLYKIDVNFKLAGSTQSHLLFTGWFAYDLGNAQKRFDEYYQLKFKYGLRHRRYLWISLDGKKNQVAGHGDTDTHKLIDYQRLASIYQNWWTQVQPVNVPQVLARVLQNNVFVTRYSDMLAKGECVVLQQPTITWLKIQLQVELQRKLLEQRTSLVRNIMQSSELTAALAKIAAYTAVRRVYLQILNNNVSNFANINEQFRETLQQLQSADYINSDFNIKFCDLLSKVDQDLDPTLFKQGAFYQKVEYTVNRLRLLLHSMQSIEQQHSPRSIFF